MRKMMIMLALTGCGDKGSDSGSAEADTAAGAQLFTSNCTAYCHGSDGDSGSAPDLSERVPTLSDDELRSLWESGQGYMPAVPLSDEEASDLIAYLRQTFP